MTDWSGLTYVVVDVEGNGQQPPDLVELAVVPIIGGAIGEPAGWLVRPQRPITRFAEKIHGISNNDVADLPAFGAVKNQVRDALNGPYIVAHNAHIDVDVISRALDGWEAPEVFDTLKLARRLIPGQPSYKLGALVDLLKLADGLPEGLSPHRATYDALVAARLFVELASRATSLEILRGRRSGAGDNETSALF